MGPWRSYCVSHSVSHRDIFIHKNAREPDRTGRLLVTSPVPIRPIGKTALKWTSGSSALTGCSNVGPAAGRAIDLQGERRVERWHGLNPERRDPPWSRHSQERHLHDGTDLAVANRIPEETRVRSPSLQNVQLRDPPSINEGILSEYCSRNRRALETRRERTPYLFHTGFT